MCWCNQEMVAYVVVVIMVVGELLCCGNVL